MQRTQIVRLALVATLASGGALGAAALSAGTSHGDADSLAGSYRLAITVANPPLGTFTDNMAFNPAGRSVVSTRTLYLPSSPAGALLESPGIGSYSQCGRDTFTVVLENLVQGAPGNGLLNGGFFATERITWTATLDDKTGNLSGPWSSTFTDPVGNVLLAANGSITGVPLK